MPTTCHQDLPDAQLLTAIGRSGDHAAFEELFMRHKRDLYAMAVHITGSQSLAEDALQEGMLRVWRKSSNFRESGNPRGWLFKIVAMECVRLARLRRRQSITQTDNIGDLEMKYEASINPAGQAQDEALAHLRKLMTALEPMDRTLFALYYGAGLSQCEIGKALSLKQQTVSNKLSSALVHLKQQMQKAGFAAAVPLLDKNIQTAICTGFELPSSIETQIRLSSRAHHQTNSAAFDPMPSLALKAIFVTIAVAVAPAAIYHFGYASNTQSSLQQAPQSQQANSVTRPKTNTSQGTHTQSTTKSKVLAYWNFNDRSVDEFRVVSGQWTWTKGSASSDGYMQASNVWVLTPIQIPNELVRISIRYHPITRSKWKFGALRCTSTSLQEEWVWRNKNVYLDWKEGIVNFYIIRNYIISAYDDGPICGISKYDSEATATRLCLSFSNMNIFEILVSTLNSSELPEHFHDPDALIRAPGWSVEKIPARPFPEADYEATERAK